MSAKLNKTVLAEYLASHLRAVSDSTQVQLVLPIGVSRRDNRTLDARCTAVQATHFHRHSSVGRAQLIPVDDVRHNDTADAGDTDVRGQVKSDIVRRP